MSGDLVRYLVGKRVDEPAPHCVKCGHAVDVRAWEYIRRRYPPIICSTCAQDVPMNQLFMTPP